MSEEDDLPPELDDFQTHLKSININSKKNNTKSTSEDYTKVNTRHIQDQQKFKAENTINKNKQVKIQKQIQKTKKKQQFAGIKKGFFSSSSNSASSKTQPKKQKIPEIKATKKNPLQIKQVQQAMKMNNYLDETRKQWMTQNFLTNVTSNQKINKLFSNPQYMKAIQMFKTNPKQAMMRYGNNKQFMEGFQQFCKMMGMQFQSLAAQSKGK